MRHIFSLMFLFVTTFSVAQQINPVPDYIFRNQMSVGRNAPTDTAAYLSVGPRFGAVKGFMPPMVVDTNAVTGVKRNGLLIFSVQLNNFAYWDSTTFRFRKITAEAVVDSVLFATRAWRQKGDDSLAAIINTKTDTALLSTRAYRQKGVDSLVTLISTLGGGTVLSVSAGTGMNFTTITTSGSVSADTNVLATRANRDKLKDSLQANIAGKVNISDTATMLSAYLRKADTTSMLSPYLRKTDTTAMLSPYVRNAGFGLTKGTQTLSVDSALMATRARVQKGIDSVASLVTTTDSVLFSTRAWRQKGVDSVAALANTKATATGTTNYLSKFTGTSSLGNSIVYATTSEVGISTPSPTHPLDVNGRVRVRTIDSTATGMNMLYADVDGVIKKAAVPAGGSGSVTSVSAGTGMSFTTITTTGSVSADTVALATRAWRQKGIDSLANVRVGGSGTTNRVAKFTASGTVGNGAIQDSSSSVAMTISSANDIGLGTTTPSALLQATAASSRGIAMQMDLPTIVFDDNSGTTGRSFIRQSNADLTIENTAANTISLRTNNATRAQINTDGELTVGPISDQGTFTLQNHNGIYAGGSVAVQLASSSAIRSAGSIFMDYGNGGTGDLTYRSGTGFGTRMTLLQNGRAVFNGSTDAGYQVDVQGTLRSTQGANFATTSGSVGIGTETPDRAFHVDANNPTRGLMARIRNTASSSRTGTQILFTQSGIADYVIGSPAETDAFAFWVNRNPSADGTELMRLTGTGRLGIGTTSPASLLHVSSDASNIRKSNAAGTAYTEHTNDGLIATGTSLTLFAPTSQSLILSSGNGEAARFNANKRLLVNTTTDAGYLVDVNGTLRTVNGANFATSSGGVRIGDATAAVSTLDVQGNISATTNYRFSNNAFSQVAIQDANGAFAGGYNLTLSGANAQHAATGGISGYQLVGGTNNSTVRFIADSSRAAGTNAAIRMSILPSGNVGIGTTSPSEALHVVGRGRFTTIDSTSSPINMLTSDVNGVIRKAAVPSSGGGTVTSVSAGTGMSFTTITTSGSVAVDTLSIATRARLYKTIDSMKSAGYTNLYNSNGTLTGNRVISKNGSNLTLSGDVGEFRVENAAGTSRVAVTNDGIYATGTSLTLFAPSAQSLILSSGNGEAGRFNADKEFLIGTSIDAGDYKFQVNGNGYVSGRMNIGSVDSFSTAQNMLFVDNDGRIKKAAVPAGGGGGVTSVSAGFGMNFSTITSTGSVAVDSVIMATRARVQKGIDSVAALARVTGSGTTNYVPLFTGSTALGNSSIYEASSEVLIGTTSDAGAFKLQVSGVVYASDGLRTTAPSGGTAHTWKLGSVVADSVALDPNNYLEVEVNGVFYRIALITLL